MSRQYTDEEILNGFRNRDNDITRVYFYDYCRVAYHIMDRRYRLRSKPGMDFYSLAHEYYLYLDNQDWRQLEDRSPNTSIKAWMTGGFRFLILDKLRQSNKEFDVEDIDARAANLDLIFDLPSDDYKQEVHQMVEEICSANFSRDDPRSIMLKMMLIEGYKGKEVAQELGLTPSAITQRYHKLMKGVVIPYFRQYYKPEVLFRCAPCVAGDRSARTVYHEESKTPRKVWNFFGLGSIIRFSKNEQDRDMKEKQIDIVARTTPQAIHELASNEVFVFGSNLAGMHGGGAAWFAYKHFGAKMGQGVGLQGQSYGIPTMQGGLDTIKPYVDEFIAFAKAHPEFRFLVTKIGCGIAGFDPDEIAPLFREAIPVENICLPSDFWAELV